MNGRAQVAARGRLSGERFHLPQAVRGELCSRSPARPDEVVGVFPYGKEDVEEAVVAAVRAARPWGQLELSARLEAMEGVRPEIIRCAQDLAQVMSRETGRPAWECQREVSGLLSRIDLVRADAPALLGDRTYDDLPARVLSVPLGVVAVLGPAMLPLSTSHTHIVAALAAGNAVVWKPSPLCPATAQLYAELWHLSGLPAGVLGMIQGDDDVGRELALHPQVDGVVFTGTSAHGYELRRALVDRHDVKLILHGSAKNAALVLEDADLELAAYEVATGAMLSAGQRCTATSRVLVHQAVLGEFTGRLVDVCAALRVGPPSREPGQGEVFMGPLLSQARLDRFLALRDAAAEQGAETLRSGERLDLPGYFVSPSVQLVHRRNPDSDYQREELFGPDLAVYPVADLDDALQLCDSGPYGLAAALFTQSPLRWKRFAEEIRVGSVFWNRSTAAPSGRMPFGGVKRSGQGGRGGADALLALRREVSLLGRTSEGIDRLPGTDPLPPPNDADSDA